MTSTSKRWSAALVAAALMLSACGSSDPDAEAAGQTTSPTSTAEQPTTPEAGDFSDLGALPEEKVQPSNVEWGDLDITDQRLFTVVAEIDETFRNHAAEIWSDDYRFDETPVAFAFRDAQGEVTKMYVVHHPDGASLPGSERVDLDESLGLGDVYRIDTPDNVTGFGANTPFTFDTDIGDTSSMLFFIPEGDPIASPTNWDYARFVVHETFHRYQLIDARWNEGAPDGADYPRVADNAALATLEDRVLAAMVATDDRDEIEHRLQQFLAIRQTRQDRFDIGNLEDTQELAEGTARYVENRYAELNDRPGRWATDTPPMSLDWLSFGRFYDTGAQLGWALDQLDNPWKDEADSGETLTSQAAATVASGDTAALVEQAQEEFDYDQILADATAADLENAESNGPGGGGGTEEIAQCLSDNGLPIDPSTDTIDGLNEALGDIDLTDPDVAAAFDACGIGGGDPGASADPGDNGPDGMAEDQILGCLEDEGIEVGPDGLAGIDPNDEAVQTAMTACGITAGEPQE